MIFSGLDKENPFEGRSKRQAEAGFDAYIIEMKMQSHLAQRSLHYCNCKAKKMREALIVGCGKSLKSVF